jgi:hypothetical protein
MLCRRGTAGSSPSGAENRTWQSVETSFYHTDLCSDPYRQTTRTYPDWENRVSAEQQGRLTSSGREYSVRLVEEPDKVLVLALGVYSEHEAVRSQN